MYRIFLLSGLYEKYTKLNFIGGYLTIVAVTFALDSPIFLIGIISNNKR